jgi:hypothetical protein
MWRRRDAERSQHVAYSLVSSIRTLDYDEVLQTVSSTETNNQGQNGLLNLFERLAHTLEEEEKLVQYLIRDHEKMSELINNHNMGINSPNGSPRCGAPHSMTSRGSTESSYRNNSPVTPNYSPRYGASPPSTRSPQSTPSPLLQAEMSRRNDSPNSPRLSHNIMESIMNAKPKVSYKRSRSPVRVNPSTVTDSFDGYESFEYESD